MPLVYYIFSEIIILLLHVHDLGITAPGVMLVCFVCFPAMKFSFLTHHLQQSLSETKSL